ncbi:hypothetical protein [Bradyrhizobium sp. USDA 3650]
MMAALVKVLSRSTGIQVEAEDLKIILIFCGLGLLLLLAAAMTTASTSQLIYSRDAPLTLPAGLSGLSAHLRGSCPRSWCG